MHDSGGSSNVFNSVLNASVENIWTSSIIKTFLFPSGAIYCVCSIRRLASSTERLRAASSSTTFLKDPFMIALHVGQQPHGSPFLSLFVQFIARARMRAVVVFPVPRTPTKRYVLLYLPDFSCAARTSVTCGCPTTSANFVGLISLYSILFYQEKHCI